MEKAPVTEVPGLTVGKAEPRTEPAGKRGATRPGIEPQPVTVVTSPKGAVATLDGQQETACATPCMLEASPGHHSLELQKQGYDVERRDVEVKDGPVDFPPVLLRSVEGTLMLTSDPAGAAVLVNGKRQPQVTPAQIQLPPGSYSVTVEWKDGKQATRTVQIKDGINFQKFLLEK
jgi:hypothetical protein